MAEPYPIAPIFDSFEGGLVTKYEPNKLNINQSPDMVNVEFTGRNSFTKRRGISVVGDSNSNPGSVRSIHNYLQIDGNEILLRARDDNSDIYLEYLDATDTWIQVPTSPLFTTNTKFGFRNFRNVVYLGNGVEDSAKWDGTTYTPLTTKNFPKANIFADFNGRLFAAGVANFENRVFYSKLSDVEDFQASGTAPDVGGEIILDSAVRAMIPKNEALIVYTQKRIFSVTISDTTGAGIVVDITGNNGAISTYSTVEVENDIFCVDAVGQVRSLGQRTNYNGLRSDVQSVAIDKTTNELDFSESAAVYHERQFLVAARSATSTFNDIVLGWDANYGTWKKFEGIFANDFTVYLGEVVFASSATQNVLKLDKSSYEDGPDGQIFSKYSLPSLTFSDGLHWKRMRYFLIKGLISENAIIKVRFIFDNNTADQLEYEIAGSDTAIVDEGVSISFGNVEFATKPFSAFAEVSEAVPLRPFLAKISLPTVNFYEVRIEIEESGANTDYVITHLQPMVNLMSPPHFEPQRVK